MYKKLMIFAGGAGIGGLIGFLVTKSVYDKLNNRDIQECEAFYQEKLDKLEADLRESKANETMAKLQIEPEKPGRKVEKDKKKESEGNEARKTRDYGSYFGKIEDEEYGPEDDSPEDDDEDSAEADFRAGERSNREMKGQSIRLIRAEEFGDDCRFEPKTLFYYAGDDILATEEDEEISDVTRVVGNSLDKFGFRVNTERVIYVRNPDFGADYEIQKVDGFFSEQRG